MSQDSSSLDIILRKIYDLERANADLTSNVAIMQERINNLEKIEQLKIINDLSKKYGISLLDAMKFFEEANKTKMTATDTDIQ